MNIELNLKNYLPSRGLKNRIERIKYLRRWRKQRATRGYADIDLFNTDNFLLGLIPKMIRDLAETGNGYPCGDEFSSFEEWSKHLHEIASHFENANEEQTVMVNENIQPWTLYFGENEKVNNTISYKEAQEKYYAREKEIFEWRNQELKKGFDMLAHVFWSLWS